MSLLALLASKFSSGNITTNTTNDDYHVGAISQNNTSSGGAHYNDASVLATVSASCTHCLVFIALFEVFRRNQSDIFGSRFHYIKNYRKIVQEPKTEFLAWISQTWHVSDEDLRKSVGLDGYVFLRFIKMIAKVCAICSFLSASCLIPVYYVMGDRFSDRGYINQCSTMHLSMRNPVMWMSLVFAYLFTFVFLYHIDQEYKKFAECKVLAAEESTETDGTSNAKYAENVQTHYTVKVENIPSGLNFSHHYQSSNILILHKCHILPNTSTVYPPNTPTFPLSFPHSFENSEMRSDETLYEFFDDFFPGDICFACILLDISSLDELVEKRQKALQRMEEIISISEVWKHLY